MSIVEKSAELARKTLPNNFINKTEKQLESTRLLLSGEEFLGITLILSIVAGVAGFVVGFLFLQLILGILLGILGFAATFIGISMAVPYYLIQKRSQEIEAALPDGLRQMASTLRAGVGMNSAMEDLAKSGYGPLSEEFERAVVEIRRGRSTEDSLAALARRSNSELCDRAFRLIVEGIERGASMADVLDSVSKDAREVQTIKRERRTATMQQVLFLVAASVFAAPFIAGLVIAVSGVFSGMGGGAIGLGEALPPGMEFIVFAFILIQAAICALAIGVIRYGRMMKGIMFLPPFMIGSGGVFYAAKIMAGFVL
ncbi:MAG: type II secretion system F family protein, partial [Hadesarchaea archaeon]|nr:type II secretion system F family protein [Hadesarchaea archaeon]